MDLINGHRRNALALAERIHAFDLKAKCSRKKRTKSLQERENSEFGVLAMELCPFFFFGFFFSLLFFVVRMVSEAQYHRVAHSVRSGGWQSYVCGPPDGGRCQSVASYGKYALNMARKFGKKNVMHPIACCCRCTPVSSNVSYKISIFFEFCFASASLTQLDATRLEQFHFFCVFATVRVGVAIFMGIWRIQVVLCAFCRLHAQRLCSRVAMQCECHVKQFR